MCPDLSTRGISAFASLDKLYGRFSVIFSRGDRFKMTFNTNRFETDQDRMLKTPTPQYKSGNPVRVPEGQQSAHVWTISCVTTGLG